MDMDPTELYLASFADFVPCYLEGATGLGPDWFDNAMLLGPFVVAVNIGLYRAFNACSKKDMGILRTVVYVLEGVAQTYADLVIAAANCYVSPDAAIEQCVVKDSVPPMCFAVGSILHALAFLLDLVLKEYGADGEFIAPTFFVIVGYNLKLIAFFFLNKATMITTIVVWVLMGIGFFVICLNGPDKDLFKIANVLNQIAYVIVIAAAASSYDVVLLLNLLPEVPGDMIGFILEGE